MKIDLVGKRALVCGASDGLGYAVAKALSDCGASVILVARRKEVLQEKLPTLNTSFEQRHDIMAVDLSQTSDLVKALQSISGPIDILVNNAGGPPPGAVFDANLEAFENALKLHLYSAQSLVQWAVPFMKQKKWGRIVNIISTSVKTPIPQLGVSNTVRGAMASWSKTLATELACYGITVNNFLPGFMETARFRNLLESKSKQSGKSVDQVRSELISSIPMGRVGRPEEAGQVIAFICSDLATYVTGTNLIADGGRTPCL